jgi:hypothetical protein
MERSWIVRLYRNESDKRPTLTLSVQAPTREAATDIALNGGGKVLTGWHGEKCRRVTAVSNGMVQAVTA